MELEIKYMDISELKPYVNNAKIPTEEQIKEIKNSIQEFGMNDPIAIWKNNEIIEGHGRLIACERLGIKKVPVIKLDKLTDEQRKAYALVHNQLTMDTGFDKKILEAELEKLDNIDMTKYGLDMPFMKEEEEKEEPEVKFTEYIDEESNYIVLKFSNSVDWLQLESIFKLPKVKAYSTREDGEINKGMERMGVGRVVDGAEFLNRIGVTI